MMATLAPSLATFLAIARPMPRLPPDMITVRFSSALTARSLRDQPLG